MFACTVSDCGVRGKFEGRGGVVVQEVDTVQQRRRKEGRCPYMSRRLRNRMEDMTEEAWDLPWAQK